MTNHHENPADQVAETKLRLAASNLKHLIHKEESVTVDAVADTLHQNIIDAHANNPVELCDAIATNARILDGMFHYYLDQATRTRYEEDRHKMALAAHTHMIRAALAWKVLKTDTYVRHKIIKYVPADKKDAERTEQTNGF